MRFSMGSAGMAREKKEKAGQNPSTKCSFFLNWYNSRPMLWSATRCRISQCKLSISGKLDLAPSQQPMYISKTGIYATAM
jgi:hypothetical protein